MKNFKDLLLTEFRAHQIDHRYPLVWKDVVFLILEEMWDMKCYTKVVTEVANEI